ncbi:lipid-A-disaccharide synthase [Flavobacteriaceae bacterium UJ101]|nr:lipid-A-disaccharide synthase [Flavobacteriaceae bacterium UJ101]
MKYYIVAGEASGDLHASNMMKEIKKNDPQATFRCWGGDLMEAQGGTIVKHYKDLAFMGFIDVILNIRTIFKNIKFCKKDIKDYNPDVVILVDYPGFNLRISDYVRNTLKIKTLYYISPTVWAWKPNRAKTIMKTVDALYVIFPFEEKWYQDHFNYSVQFVGHPLLDAIEDRENDPKELRKELNLSDKPIVLLMPGSRTREIQSMLPIMGEMVMHYPDYEFVIAGAPSQEESFYRKFVSNEVKFVSNRTYDLLSIAHAALVTSGTATLETALFNVPEIICYKGDPVSWWIAKNFLVKLDYIGIVNLIMEKEIAKELLQGDMNTNNLKKELGILLSGKGRQEMLNNYQALYKKLGGKGASKRLADQIQHQMDLK